MLIRTNKLIGSILLISGTTIGAGMLALPVLTGFGGFFPSIFQLFFCWIFMLGASFLYLEVNLSFKGEKNLLSLTEKTLGKRAKIIAWIAYLLLLYSLTAAYIAGSASLFSKAIFSLTGYDLPNFAAPFPMIILFGIFIYLGSKSADYLNRILMFGLIVTYFILAFIMPQHIDFNLLIHFDIKASFLAVPVIITSYGYNIILPTLTTYMNHNRKQLSIAIIVGSIIPLLIYILWEFLTLGVVPLTGQYSLQIAYLRGESSTGPLLFILKNALNKPWISSVASLFSFCAIITSFIGVSLSLADFLRDGLKIKKTHRGRLIAVLLTYVPPLIFVLYFQRGFILALQYAAIFVAIILCIYPALMALKLPKPNVYNNFWGRVLIYVVLVISAYIIGMEIFDELGLLKTFIKTYLQ
ncbi:MAG: tyrosine transporter [Parachlamydiales bacterium]|nr:tyrosine transporter [Parachlamydiales bacterium]